MWSLTPGRAADRAGPADSALGRAGFAALLLIAAFVRLYHLDMPGFGGDETADLFKPPMRFLLYRWVESSGLSGYLGIVVGYRLVSVAAALFSIAGFYLIARLLLGGRWGFFAALLLALCPFHVAASRLSMSHGHILATPFITWAIYLLLADRVTAASGGPWRIAASGMLFGAAAAIDMLAIFWLIWAAVIVAGRRPTGAGTRPVLVWCAAIVVGVAGVNPMWVISTGTVGARVLQHAHVWDNLKSYLWLGSSVEQIPGYYYLTVIVVRLPPLIVALLVLFAVRYLRSMRRQPIAAHLAVLALLPIVYFSWKPWKQPFYLTPYLPLLYLMAAAACRDLISRIGSSAARRVVIGVIAAGQLPLLVILHPDYLMGGIQYGAKFYGEFQGPAVSHGQWIGTALKEVAESAAPAGRRTLVPIGFSDRLFSSWAARARVPVSIWQPEWNSEEDQSILDRFDFIIVTQDSRSLIAPAHMHSLGKNTPLLELVCRNLGALELARRYSTAGFPMLWIFRVMKEGAERAGEPDLLLAAQVCSPVPYLKPLIDRSASIHP